MYVLFDNDHELFICHINRNGGVHFTSSVESARRWDNPQEAAHILEQLNEYGMLPVRADFRVMEVEDVW